MAAVSLDLSGLRLMPASRASAPGLSLSVPASGFLSVLGPTGSGKTTLIRLLAGFNRAGPGQILLDGASIGRLAPQRRGFGVMQQRDALLPGWTLEDNIGLPLALRRVRGGARQRLVQAAMELVALSPGCGPRKPGLSTPVEIRLTLLARALVFAPRLLLLDDPTAGLAEAGAATVLSAIRRAHSVLRTTVILATPRPQEALGMAEQVAVLDAGRLLHVAPPRELYENPPSARAAAIVARSNLLAGTVVTSDGDIATVTLTCGPIAEARAASGLFQGMACLLAIDPWRIAVAPVSAADMGERALDATVMDVAYQGEATRLSLLLGSGAELAVMRPSAAGLRGIAQGRRVAIAWEPHHATAYPAEI